jgi:chain length determinant protein tyrosine kinase EpsG
MNDTSAREHAQARAIEGSSRVMAADNRIGAILVGEGRLQPEHIGKIMELQRLEGVRFGEAALQLGLIKSDDLHHAIARQYDLPHLLAGSGHIGRELVVARQPFHPRAEEMRALRTQLSLRWNKARMQRRVLAVVSPGPREGRSYVTANLALAFAQVGERTLVIDADLRSPRQHAIFSVPDRVGLSAVLSGRAAGGGGVMPVPEFGALSLLPAGAPPPNPQELLSRPALAVLLHELAVVYDVIIVDTPPATVYADAQAIAYQAGNALVVVRKDHTRLDDTKGIIRELGDMGTHVAGTVLNVQ